jgi:hypothetical protein
MRFGRIMVTAAAARLWADPGGPYEDVRSATELHSDPAPIAGASDTYPPFGRNPENGDDVPEPGPTVLPVSQAGHPAINHPPLLIRDVAEESRQG